MATLRKQLKIRWKRPPTAYWSGFLRWRAFLIPCKIAELCANIVHASPFLFFPGKLRMRWCCHRKRVPPSKSLTSIWGIYSVVVESVCLCSVQWLSTAIDWAANTDAPPHPLLCDTFLLALDDSDAHTLQWSKGAVNRCKSHPGGWGYSEANPIDLLAVNCRAIMAGLPGFGRLNLGIFKLKITMAVSFSIDHA